MLVCLLAAAGTAAKGGADGIVSNSHFRAGGYSYADCWRPLPGSVRIHRQTRRLDGVSLYLELRDDGDGGVMQIVQLPPKRTLSLRMLATCWANGDDCLTASLVRCADGVVLAEVTVDGIERGELAADFDTGPGGPTELAVRLVGSRGARASVEYVVVDRAVKASAPSGPVFASQRDLLLEPGEGVSVEADFTPRLLPVAAEMLQAALEDASGRATERVAAGVVVSVPQPESESWPARESYHLGVSESGVAIAASAEQGAFWAMMTLIDLIRPEPGGGARILAVDAHDGPALPWRIARSLAWPASVANAACSLARLKFNMAEVALTGGDEDRAAVDALRTVGIEPVVAIAGGDADTTRAALEDALARLDARYLIVSSAVEDEEGADDGPQALDWAGPPLCVAVEFARAHPDVSVIVPASRRLARSKQITLPLRLGIVGLESFEGWPAEVIALLPGYAPEQLAQIQAELRARGISYLTTQWGRELDAIEAALRARAETQLCLGSVIEADFEQAANLAWRGLPPAAE
ncbi:MAG: glycoside hydrolase family 20 zincin-like fold domain-containing protein [Armatimonadota bacterium]